MKIIIKDEKDLKRFYRRLFWYKSYLFSFTKFELVGKDKYHVSNIINALNIKNKYKRALYVNEEAIKQVDAYYGEYNMCGFKNSVCFNKLHNGCCRFCKHCTDSGCPSKNLACKMFNCTEVKCRHSVITYDDLKILKCLNMRRRYVLKNDLFSLKEEVEKDLRINCMTYSAIRMYYRLLFKQLPWNIKKRKSK